MAAYCRTGFHEATKTFGIIGPSKLCRIYCVSNKRQNAGQLYMLEGKNYIRMKHTCTRSTNGYLSSSVMHNVRPNLSPNLKINLNLNAKPNDTNYLYKLYCTDSGGEKNINPQSKRKVKPVFVAVPNPFKIFRNWMFGVIIRAYFDADFTFKDFTEGAKQGLSIIANEMAEGDVDNLESMVSPKLLTELKDVIGRMSLIERSSLSLSVEDVLYSFPHNVTVHYDDSGGKFLYILMRFWYVTTKIDSEASEAFGLKIGQPPPGVSEEEFNNMGSVISCTYEFFREVTPGVDPEWTVTHIQHGKLINTEATGLPP